MSSISSLSVSSSPALVASRARRLRSNAVSRTRECEAEWDSADAPSSPTSTSTASPPPWRDDDLVCPLALDTRHAHADSHTQVHAPTNLNSNSKAPLWGPVPVWPANEGELQAVLAQFAFPASGRKHSRSGGVIPDKPPTSVALSASAAPAAAVGSGKRRSAPGPVRRAWCAHCERGRNSA